jgi:hypothetical protein
MAERIWLGHLGSGVYGLKISKPGVAVGTASDSDLLLDTSSNFARFVQMGQLIFAAGPALTVNASVPNIGGTAPVVVFKYAEISSGSIYLFPLWRNETNTQTTTTNTLFGWNATAVSGTISVTRNYSSSTTNYVYYFMLAQSI